MKESALLAVCVVGGWGVFAFTTVAQENTVPVATQTSTLQSIVGDLKLTDEQERRVALILQEESDKCRETLQDTARSSEQIRQRRQALEAELRKLGCSRGVWPCLSAEVALWHLRLRETDEAWCILRAIADRSSATGCRYEEIDHQPPHGHGDPADVWAAAETVYLARPLVLQGEGKKRNNQ